MRAVTTAQHISWFADHARRGLLQLDPPYQRKPVWGIKQRSALIETLLLDLPVPEVFVQPRTSSDGTTTYAVVDGQQRIRSVLKFLDLDAEIEDNGFALELEDLTSEWSGIAFADLDDEQKQRLYSRSLAVRMLDSDANREAIRDLFRRFNKYLLPLTPQELRNAQFDGPLIKLASELAEDSFWIAERLVTPQAVRRMKDIEFVSELMIGVMYGPQAGNAATLDKFYRQLEAYDTQLPNQDETLERFQAVLAAIQRLFPDGLRGRRWGNRTDFYTLFVAMAELIVERKLLRSKEKELATRLMAFADMVNERLADEHFVAQRNVIAYVRAVEKGASDRSRRIDRHDVMIRLLEPSFAPGSN